MNELGHELVWDPDRQQEAWEGGYYAYLDHPAMRARYYIVAGVIADLSEKLHSPLQIVDVGCGQAVLPHYLGIHHTYHGLDLIQPDRVEYFGTVDCRYHHHDFRQEWDLLEKMDLIVWMGLASNNA